MERSGSRSLKIEGGKGAGSSRMYWCIVPALRRHHGTVISFLYVLLNIWRDHWRRIGWDDK